MVTKKQFTLGLAIAFCLGFFICDFSNPKGILAQAVPVTTNIIYDTLNGRIQDLRGQHDALSNRVNGLTDNVSSNSQKIEALSSSVKKLAELQKSSIQSDVSPKEFEKLRQDVLKLKASLQAMRELQFQ